MSGIVKYAGVKVEFADGRVLTVPPLSLGAIQQFQERIMTFKGGLDNESIVFVLDLTTHALQRNYPEITRDDVANDLVDVSNMEGVVAAVMDVSGLARKKQAAEEKAQAN